MIRLLLRLTLMIIVLALWLGFIGIILISDARPVKDTARQDHGRSLII